MVRRSDVRRLLGFCGASRCFPFSVDRGPWTVHESLFLPFPISAFAYGLKRLDIVANTFSSFFTLGLCLGLERTDFIEGRGKGEEGRGAGFWHFWNWRRLSGRLGAEGAWKAWKGFILRFKLYQAFQAIHPKPNMRKVDKSIEAQISSLFKLSTQNQEWERTKADRITVSSLFKLLSPCDGR